MGRRSISLQSVLVGYILATCLGRLHGALQVFMMLTTRVQPKVYATNRRSKAAGRSVALKVVAFKNSDEEVQQVSTAKVTFQIPMHGRSDPEQQAWKAELLSATFCRQLHLPGSGLLSFP